MNPSFPYVKVIDIGERIIVNNIQGYLQSRIVFFLMNVSMAHLIRLVSTSVRSEQLAQ